MDTANWIALGSLAVNVLIFVIGALILPTLQATKTAMGEVTKELHNMQIEMAGLKVHMGAVEGLRSNLHNLRDDIHTMQMRMALAGIWKLPGQKEDSGK